MATVETKIARGVLHRVTITAQTNCTAQLESEADGETLYSNTNLVGSVTITNFGQGRSAFVGLSLKAGLAQGTNKTITAKAVFTED